LTVASLGLILLLPLMLLLALLVRICIGAPVIFRQQRPGYREKPFQLYKFRTMTDARAASGALLPDRDRLVPVGRWMRLLSLDELPELFNILRGGELGWSASAARRFALSDERTSPSGARSDWLASDGRNALDWPSRFALDLWYVDHWSFWLDLKILLLTLWKAVAREGVSQPGQATTEYFTGNKD
jgi:lipopolysaccharide/colanic/teichoic acid biosynthesis glycosyltransferase